MFNKYISHKNKVFQHLTGVLVIVVVAGIGAYLLIFSHAASPYVSVTADNGTQARGATKQTCSGSSDGNCVVFPAPTTPTSCATSPPTVSSNSEYPLGHVTMFSGTNFGADDFQDYGNEVQSPGGYVATSHAVPTASALLIEGYPDSISGSVGGVTGGSGDIGGSDNVVSTSGGFDVCFSMSSGNWQNVHIVIISWPTDSVWGEGENDFFEGNPQNMAINVHEIGSSPQTNVWQGKWPSSLASGAHVISARWNPTDGYQFLLDGTLVGTAAPTSSITTPTTPHHLTMQMQDTTESSTSTETATFYWMATYNYSK